MLTQLGPKMVEEELEEILPKFIDAEAQANTNDALRRW